MALYSEAELDVKARATVFSLDRNLEHARIVRQIGEQYTRLCDSPEAKKLSIKSRKITEGAQLRLLFEALCFTSFLTFQIIPKYVSTRKLIRKKINHQLVNYYINRVARHLLGLCQDLGMTKLRDIVLISTPPETKIKFGDPLNPVVRLKEYTECLARKRGSETDRFGEHIGRALDPYHYQELATLTRPQVSTLSKLAEEVMTEVFKPSVKLKA
jgi:hypothetical protein